MVLSCHRSINHYLSTLSLSATDSKIGAINCQAFDTYSLKVQIAHCTKVCFKYEYEKCQFTAAPLAPLVDKVHKIIVYFLTCLSFLQSTKNGASFVEGG